MHKLSKSTVITQDAEFFPDVGSAGDCRAAFDFGTVTKFSKWPGRQNAPGNVYATNPPNGKRRMPASAQPA
jgi:hypothetical protein